MRSQGSGWPLRGAGPAAALLLVVTALAGAAERVQVAVGDSPSLGPPDAPVTMVEFVDFQ